jgi:uncharacterized protein DUF3237
MNGFLRLRSELRKYGLQVVRHPNATIVPEVLARLGRGEDVDASEYTFRTSTQIETAGPDLDWLNKGVFGQVSHRELPSLV